MPSDASGVQSVAVKDSDADTLNAQEAENVRVTAPVAGNVLGEALAKVEDLAFRVADLEEKLSPILHLIPGISAIASMADELASIVENLKRGRVAT